MSKNAGFTLLEVMLALVLLSLSAVFVSINLPSSQEDVAEEEARRFYHRLLLLNEDAILNGTDFGIRFEEASNSYRFLRLTGEGWQLYEHKRYPETKLKEELTLSFSLGNSVWNNNESLFNQTSLFDEEMFAEYKEEQQQKPPQVFVLSSGEITPFSLSILPEDVKREENSWRIVALETGVVELLAPGENSGAAQ